MKRPDIKDTIGLDIREINAEYLISPLLYMHIKNLDKYIDHLEGASPAPENDQNQNPIK